MLSVIEGQGGRQQQLELYFLSWAFDSCNWIQFSNRKLMLSFRGFNTKYFSLGFTGFILSLQNEVEWLEKP